MTGRNLQWARAVAGIAAWVVSFGVTAARAQAPTPQPARVYVDPVRGQSIDDLVAFALRQSPDASAVRARVDVARGGLDQAGRRPLPSLSFERREEVGGTDHQTGIGLIWPLDLSRRSGRTAVAGRSVEAANEAVAERERRLATEVRLLAVRLLGALRQLQVRQEVAEANRTTSELIAARVESGAAPAVERDAAHIESKMSEVEVRRQRAEVETAAAALRSAVGLEPGAPLVLRESLDDVALGADSSTGVRELTGERIQEAVNARPDLRQAEAEIAREVAAQDLIKREGGVDLSLVASYMRTVSGFPQLGMTATGGVEPIHGTFDMVTVGAMVMLPWGNRNQGAVAAAGAAIEVARHERESRRVSALNEIDALRQREALARNALGIFAGGLRALAAQNLEILRESYQLGRATLLDVLAEHHRYLGVEAAYASALLELALARAALAGALGETR